MSTFLGIGLGPIQTGIFLSGAFNGGCKRIVVAEVDSNLVAAVRASGSITINIAASDKIYSEKIDGIEIYNPLEPEDLQALIKAAAEADEIATALPGVAFFKHIAPWLCEGFALEPERRRFIYTAENDNHAAEKLKAEIATDFANTHYLNTVVGKMSKVFEESEANSGILPLCPDVNRGHLVEEFNRILISRAPGIENRKVTGLHPKDDLYPFEEAKLYGHNAIHFMLGWNAQKMGLEYMSEIAGKTELLGYAGEAFNNESGQALCHKWQGVDELFTPDGFKAYADDLLIRMTNPFLNDSVQRVVRDLPRKMSWDDRVLGTVRLCLDNQVTPEKFIELAGECYHQMRHHQS